MLILCDKFKSIQSHGKCLADLCGALHCDFMMNSKSSRSKCNPAAVVKNRHLCEVVSTSIIAGILDSHVLF